MKKKAIDHLNKSRIFYFSGTGNSYRVAVWSKDHINEYINDSEICPIDKRVEKQEILNNDHLFLGVIFPTHCFSPPWSVIRRILKFPRLKNAKAFVIATRGCLKLGKFILKGSAGYAAFLVAFLLFLKGYEIRGIKGLDMPANFTSVHPGMRKKNIQWILETARKKTTLVIGDMFSGKKVISGWGALITGLVFLPLSLLYQLIGRFMAAKMYLSSNLCDGCGICARSCPQQAIEMLGKNRPKPYWTFRCVNCMRCLNFCPRGAIHFNLLPGIIMFYLINAPFFWVIYGKIIGNYSCLKIFSNIYLKYLFFYFFMLGCFWMIYLLFFSLNLIPIFKKLFPYLSLSNYMRRYKEPGTSLVKLTDFSKYETKKTW